MEKMGRRRKKLKKTRELREEGSLRGCRSVGVASASSRVRLTSDLFLKRFHCVLPPCGPPRPRSYTVPRAARCFFRMQMLTLRVRTFACIYIYVHA